jgi:hypothetical protein
MFGKLIKHEFKNTWRYMLVINAAVVLLSLIGMLQMHLIKTSSSYFIQKMSTVYMVLYVLAIIALVVVTFFYLVGRFYKKMFTTEGYLMHTLPVTADQHIGSMLITDYVWWLEFSAVSMLCLFFCFFTEEVNWSDFSQVLTYVAGHVHVTPELVALIIAMIISPAVMLLNVYCALALGQLFKTHRILGAVIVYIVMYLIVSGISNNLILGGFGGRSMMGSYFFSYEGGQGPEAFFDGMNAFLGTFGIYALVSNLVVGAIYWFLTRFMIRNRLDIQ